MANSRSGAEAAGRCHVDVSAVLAQSAEIQEKGPRKVRYIPCGRLSICIFPFSLLYVNDLPALAYEDQTLERFHLLSPFAKLPLHSRVGHLLHSRRVEDDAGRLAERPAEVAVDGACGLVFVRPDSSIARDGYVASISHSGIKLSVREAKHRPKRRDCRWRVWWPSCLRSSHCRPPRPSCSPPRR